MDYALLGVTEADDMDAQDIDHIPEEVDNDDVVDPEALDTDDDGSQSEDDVQVDMDDSDGMTLYLCFNVR